MSEKPILFSGSMVRAILDGTDRGKLYPRPGETPLFPSHIARRLANGIMSAADGACWIWIKSKNRDGYGTLTVGGRTIHAHRLAFELSSHVILPGQHVRHTCDNPPCINPAHLVAGTRSDNMQDMVRRGRHGGPPPAQHGGENPAAKLTPAEVAEIRRCFRSGESQASIARVFGICQSQVSNIHLRKHWA